MLRFKGFAITPNWTVMIPCGDWCHYPCWFTVNESTVIKTNSMGPLAGLTFPFQHKLNHPTLPYQKWNTKHYHTFTTAVMLSVKYLCKDGGVSAVRLYYVLDRFMLCSLITLNRLNYELLTCNGKMRLYQPKLHSMTHRISYECFHCS